MQRPQAVLVAVGGGLLAGSWWVARQVTSLPGWEGSLTLDVNRWPDWLVTPIWPVMQMGNVWMVAVLPVGVYLWQRRWRAAAAAAVAPLAAWAFAKGVKELAARGRPADYLDSVAVREAGVHGYGFVSGHAAVAFASATVVSVYLPARWRVVPFAVAGVTGIARVYVGAHLPLDVIGGAGLGVACGALALWLFGEPEQAPAAAAVAAT